MRIAYLSCVMPPYPGGIGVAAAGMAAEMMKRGHSVETFAPFHPFRPLVRFGNAAFLPQLLWRLRNFDIVHLLYPFYGVAELVPLLRRTTRAKIVVHHMMDAVAPGWLGRAFAWHTRYLMPRIFRAADRVLTLSEDYYQNSWLARLSFPQEKLAVVPHGIDVGLFCPSSNTVISTEPQASGEISPDTHMDGVRSLDFARDDNILPKILFVGGLDRAHYFKGVPVLIEACRILRERGVKFQCQIIGDGDMRLEYERQAKESGIRNQKSGVDFVGLVPHEELPAYYARAAVGVVPSTERIECFSIVAAEAQSCGIPVIVTDFPGVRVTIEQSKTGFVIPPGNAQALAERLQWILKHPQEARAMGAAGRTRVEKMYSWKVVGDRLEDLYKELL